MKNSGLFNSFSPETLIVRLYSEKNSGDPALLNDLKLLLPRLNWRSHLYIIDDVYLGQAERISEVILQAADFLMNNKFATMHIHPFVRMYGFEQSEVEEWEMLLGLMESFQQEAYNNQSEVRMLILPILEPREGTSKEVIMSAAEFFGKRTAKPSFYFYKKSPIDIESVIKKQLRVYIDNDEDRGVESIIARLMQNHIFETILERVEEGAALLRPCKKHLIMDGLNNSLFPCYELWRKGMPLDSLEGYSEFSGNVDCTGCIGRACLSMDSSILANDRIEEGRRVYMGIGMAFSGEGRHRNALMHAERAHGFSSTDAHKAAALLLQGLSYLNMNEFEQAEDALKKGAAHSGSTAVFSYHLGRVMFNQGNYVEALDFFEDALEADSDEVPKDDLLFNLAVGYVRLEEYSSAMSCIEQIKDESAPVRFYKGICLLADGQAKQALKIFKEALKLGPSREDLSSVLFYIGSCYKEMEQYEDAVTELDKAIKADPSEYLYYNQLGFCLFKLNRYEESIEALHKAIKIDPDAAIDYASIGSNLREMGRLEDAVAMYKMALSMDPTIGFARSNLKKLTEIIKGRP